MIEAPIPADDVYRLAALHALPLLDTPPEPDFDAIVQLGQSLFRTETCLVSLVDANRQWFKACIGLDVPETPRAISFCGHAILQPDVFVIPDAREDMRFHDNPVVTGTPFIRFYAGAPILLPNGYTIGTVCIFDPRPRHDFGMMECARLSNLAKLALSAITARAMRGEADKTRQQLERHQAALLATPAPVALLDPAGRLAFHNDAFAALCARWPHEGDGVADLLDLDWTPACMAEQAEMRLPHPALPRGLAVYRDADGFILTAAV